jgi:hypothetical protein
VGGGRRRRGEVATRTRGRMRRRMRRRSTGGEGRRWHHEEEATEVEDNRVTPSPYRVTGHVIGGSIIKPIGSVLVKLVHAQRDGKAAVNFGKQFFPHVFMWEINFR